MKNLSAIIRLFIANTVSGFAQGISMIAIPWYFTKNLDAPSLMGAIYFAITFTTLFWGLYAGTLVDRFNRKYLFIAETSVGAMVLLTAAAIGFYLQEVPIAIVAGVWAMTFWGYNLHYPALYAFMQEITEAKDYGRITSYLEIQGQTTGAFAGGLGAFLLSGINAGYVDVAGWQLYQPFTVNAWSLQQIFLLDGLTYCVAFLCILPISYKAVSKRYKEVLPLVQRFKIGVDFLKNHRVLFVFGNAAYFVFVTTMLLTWLIVPNFVDNYLNAEAYIFGVGEMCFALGALFSGFMINRLFARSTNVMGCIVTTCISASAFVVLAFDRHIGVFLLMMVLLGLSNSGSRIMRVTYMFKHIPNQVLGRTQSVFQVINVLFRLSLIALLSLPFFVHNIGYAFIVLTTGCIVAAGVLVYYYKELVGNS